MNEEKDPEIKYLSNDEDLFHVEKKIYLPTFIFQEFFIFLCITLGSYFSIFISSQKFATEESFSKSFLLVFEFFTLENLIDTSIGLFIVMGILCFVNHLTTHSELNIQPILNRLISAVTDFYCLMFSTILGCMLGLFHFLHKFPDTERHDQLHQLAIGSLITIGLVGSATAIAIQFFVHKNKVLYKKPD
jgi:uncharacterized membrane protein YidH (DUF202 family)